MVLMIDGKPAKVMQAVSTCRGKAILLDWREPYALYEDTGEVTIKELGNKNAQAFAPSAIDGEFVNTYYNDFTS